MLIDLAENLFTHMRMIRRKTIGEVDRTHRSIHDHMDLICALEIRDTERAEVLVRNHALGLAEHVAVRRLSRLTRIETEQAGDGRFAPHLPISWKSASRGGGKLVCFASKLAEQSSMASLSSLPDRQHGGDKWPSLTNLAGRSQT